MTQTEDEEHEAARTAVAEARAKAQEEAEAQAQADKRSKAKARRVRDAGTVAFFGLLVGLGAADAVRVLQPYLGGHGRPYVAIAMALTYLMIVFDAIVIGQVNLLLSGLMGLKWIINAVFFLAVSVTIIFMGSVVTPSASASASAGFFGLVVTYQSVVFIWSGWTLWVFRAHASEYGLRLHFVIATLSAAVLWITFIVDAYSAVGTAVIATAVGLTLVITVWRMVDEGYV